MAVNDVYCDMSQLGPEIRKMIQEYKEHSLAQIDRAVEETTKDSKDIIKAKANVDHRNTRRRGKYKRSITYKIERELAHTRGVIYASGHEYSLTHLLENGHNLWNSPRRTRAFKHWKDGETNAIKELPSLIEKYLKG